MYFDKELHGGYNVYIDAARDDLGTQMDVGVLALEPGDVYDIHDPVKESAVLLLSGKVELSFGDETVLCNRPDCFHHEACCLLAPRNTAIVLKAVTH
ncbi:MAG: 5-deoxy-glucuronate isomerase, partial [Clostridia bacterium]|nr:5-deoxy-glucuronate isomerase [Clostridia bacterium]